MMNFKFEFNSSTLILSLFLALFISLPASALDYHACEIQDGPDKSVLVQAYGTNFAKFIGRDVVIHINFGDKPMSTWLETFGGVELFYTSINVLNPQGEFFYHGILDDIDIQCRRL